MRATKRSGASRSSRTPTSGPAKGSRGTAPAGDPKDIQEAYRRKAEQLRLLSEVVRTANSMLEPEALTAYIMGRIQALVQS